MADQVGTEDQSTILVPTKKRKRNANAASGPRKPREKPIECPVCLTGRAPKLILEKLACNCVYCVPCIRELFSISLQSEDDFPNFPARCCGNVLDHVLLEGSLTPQLRRAYRSKAEEMSSNDPLYCGNPDCGAFILEASIKDDFGSCGKCKMKTCIKKECNKTKAEHLGVHDICPGELDTEELRILIEEKGWKRCPKCYALTERTRGCDDIRCYCRTEWCYKCGKALRGNKNMCVCYPARAAPPIPPPVQPTQDNVQVQRETMVIHDEDDQDTNMIDVKPSIEELQRDSEAIFYTETDLMAELDRRANLPTQSSSRNLTAQPEASSSRVERDFIQELDALAIPNAREAQNLSQHTFDISATNVERDTFSVARERTVDAFPDDLEDMLREFESYEASSSSSNVAAPSVDLGDSGTDPVDYLPQPARHDSSDPVSSSSTGSYIESLDSDSPAINKVPELPHYAHTPSSEADRNSSTLNTTTYQDTSITTPEEPNLIATSEQDPNLKIPIFFSHPVTKPELKSGSPPYPSFIRIDEVLDSVSETVETEDPAIGLNADWLMDSIEAYLGNQDGDDTEGLREVK